MLKSVGIVRSIDQLGRLVLPAELRKTMDLPEGTPLEIYTDGNTIILKKYQPNCAICHESDDLVPMLEKHGIKICRACYRLAAKG